MDDLIQKIGMDVTGAKTAIRELEASLESHGLGIDNLAKKYGKFNENGKLLELVLSFISKEGKRLDATFTDINSGGKVVKVAKQLSQYNDVLKETRSAAQEAVKIQEELNRALEKSKRAVSDLLKANAAQAETLKKNNELEQARSLLLQKISQASGGKINIANAQETQRLNSAINKVIERISAGKFTLKEFIDALVAVDTQGAKGFIGLGEALSKSVSSVQNAVDKLGKAETDHTNKVQADNQKILAAVKERIAAINAEILALKEKYIAEQRSAKVFDTVKKNLSGQFAAGDAKGLEKQNIILGRMSEIFRKAQVSATDYKNILNAISTGTMDKLSAEHQRIAKLILDYQREATKSYGKAKDDAKAYIDVLNVMNQALQTAAEKSKIAAESLDRQRNAAKTIAGLRSSNPTADLKPDQLIQVERVLGNIHDKIRFGRASLNDFAVAQKAVASGTTAELTPAQKDLARSLQELDKAYKGVTKSGVDSGERITISWAGLFRLFLVQTLHKAISQLTFEFVNSVKTATEFGIKIGEIQTISLNSTKTFTSWSQEVRALSDRFGELNTNVAEGTYQALSNQVIDASKSMAFMTTAMKFSQAAVTSADNSVNLLSAGLKSFRIDASDAERVAGVMFKTIELGRVRADEMANTFGRVGGLAHSLGISLEEVGSAISVLTVQGVGFSEAETLINNILLKLVKPTEEMTALFKQWGVSSGEAAIATFGFEGVLRKFDQEAAQGSNRLGDLFNEMRALRGIIGLSGEAFKDFDSVLEKITNGGVADFRKAADLMANNDAKKLQVEFNKVKNFFTHDVGSALVGALTKIIDTFGSLKKAVADGITVLLSATSGFIAYKSVLSLVGKESSLVTTSIFTLLGRMNGLKFSVASLKTVMAGFGAIFSPLNILSLAIAGIAASFAKAQQNAIDFKNAVVNRISEISDEYGKLTQKLIDQDAKIIKSHKDGLDARLKDFLQYTTQVQIAATKLADALVKVEKDSLELFKVQIKGIIDLNNDAVRNAERTVKDLTNIIEESKKQIANIANNSTNKTFDRRVSGTPDPSGQARLIEDEIARLDKQIQDVLAKGAAAGIEGLKATEELAKRQIELADRLAQIRGQQNRKLSAEEEKNQKAQAVAQVKEHEQTIKNIQAQLVILNKKRLAGGLTQTELNRLTNNENDLKDKMEKELKLAEEAKNIAKGKVDIAQKQLEAEKAITDAYSNQLELLKNIQKAAEEAKVKATQEAEAKAKQQQDFNLATERFIDFKPEVKNKIDPTQDIEKQVEAIKNQRDKDLNDLTANLKAKYAEFEKDGVKRLELDKIIEERKKAILEKSNADLTVLQASAYQEKAKQDAEALQKELENSETRRKTVIQNTENTVKNVEGQLAKARALFNGLEDLPLLGNSERTNAAIKQFDDLTIALKSYLDAPTPEKLANLDRLLEGVKKLQENFSGGAELRNRMLLPMLNTDLPTLEEAQKFAAIVNEIEVEMNKLTPLFNAKQRENSIFNIMARDIQELKNRMTDAGIAITNTNTATTTMAQTSIEKVRNTVVALDALILKYKELEAQINATSAANGIPRALGGGVPYFTSGGFVKRGFDTRLIAAAPGEFVMNQRATMRNYTQIIAMNQGREPRNFVQGGNVTTVGDINITVQGGTTPAPVVQQIGQQLRREIRLGKLSF